MENAIAFSMVNVGAGAMVSWGISHYLLPIMFGVERSKGRAFKVTAVFTVAALIRNVIIYGVFNA